MFLVVVVCAFAVALTQFAVSATEPKFAIQALAEKKIDRLPAGPLYWRVETYPTLSAAEAATGPTTLVAEADGKVWLFTLGPKGNAGPGATKVAEIGPVPEIRAPEYLLRINRASGPPGAKTPPHTHPGSESFYVLGGQLSQKTTNGSIHLNADQGMTGQEPGTVMQVSSSGTSDLTALVMFVVDATKPFSTPGKFS
jgi:quercetin dioxygenase-like cupin family protein